MNWGISKTALLVAAGAFIYAGIGIAAMLWGGNYLDYGVSFGKSRQNTRLGNPGHRSRGYSVWQELYCDF